MNRAGMKKVIVAGVAIVGLALWAAQAKAGWWGGCVYPLPTTAAGIAVEP